LTGPRVAPSNSAPVLLLHGQPGGARDWDRVRAALGSRAETIAPHRPGWDGRAGATDLPGNVSAALAALDRSGAPRATVVGHSFGAAVAAWLAAEHPQRVDALVLVAPAANVASLLPLDHLLAAPVGGYLASAALLSGMGLALSVRRVRGRLADALGLEDRYLEVAGRAVSGPSAWRSFVIEQRALVRGLPRLEERLGRISAPAAVLAGTADRIVPMRSARALARQIPGAELVVLSGASHLIPQQHADRVAAVIAEVGG
jgi:pimeloyl-ACP methyl ester carboxylesterase